MKHFILLINLLGSMILNAQNYKGKVFTPSNKPIPYANVVLYTLPDSVFIAGTITNGDGNFFLNTEKETHDCFLKISSIGFQTQTVTVSNHIGTIILQKAEKELDEIIVKGVRKVYKMENGILRANIKNSVLGTLGTANDVLSQLPYVIDEEGKFIVLGRGTPIIYVDNRKIESTNELNQLNSNEIKGVEIVLNPGAEYDATTNSVIKVTTYRKKGGGLSGWLYGILKMKRNLNQFKSLSLNYRKGGLDFFFYGNHNRSKTEQNQKDRSTFLYNNEILKVVQDGKLNYQDNYIKLQTGGNYIFDEKHMFGAKYTYKREQNSPVSNIGTQEAFLGEYPYKNSVSKFKESRDGERHHVNTYYDGKIADCAILHFDGDIVVGNNGSNKQTINSNIIGDTLEIVPSISNTDYYLYAGKLWLKKSIFEGEILLGNETSYTRNEQNYKMLNPDFIEVTPNSFDLSKQLNISPFVTFSKRWHNIGMNVGARYEYVKYEYFLNNIKQESQSKTYNRIFPTVLLSYDTPKLSMSINYRNSISRPSYYQLRNSITYNDLFAYESGNPSLKPSKIDNFTFTASYKKIMIDLLYRHISDYILFTVRQFDDKPALLFSPVNHEMDTYSALVSYVPTISFWKPTFVMGISWQNLEYQGVQYNKSMFEYSVKNIFNLPQKFTVIVNLRGTSFGNKDIVEVKPDFRSDFSIRKQFGGKRWTALFGISDIFNTSRERWEMKVPEISVKKWNDMDAHSIYLTIKYNFNAMKKKRYKGESATNEINRL